MRKKRREGNQGTWRFVESFEMGRGVAWRGEAMECGDGGPRKMVDNSSTGFFGTLWPSFPRILPLCPRLRALRITGTLLLDDAQLFETFPKIL